MARPVVNGAYSVPKEIMELKPEQIPCMVKLIPTQTQKGTSVHYYVYESNGKGAGKTIGKIEGGKFCPNKRGQELLRPKSNGTESKQGNEGGSPTNSLSKKEEEMLSNVAANLNLDLADLDLQIKDYGEYAVVLACTSSVLSGLEKCFSDLDATLIYALGIIYFIQDYTPASYVKDVYDQSILSNKWPSLAISENKVNEFLKLLGLHPRTCDEYYQGLIQESSGMTAIDGHVILSCSKQNDLADYGNKYTKIGNTQLNVLEAYDVINCKPLTSKAYEGGVLDKVSVKDLMVSYEFAKGTTFLIDMGFYSEEDVGLYRQGENFFIIPVPDSAIISKSMRKSITFTGHFTYPKTDANGNTYDAIIMYRESTVSELEQQYQEYLDAQAAEKNKEAKATCAKGEKPKKFYSRKITRSDFGSDRIIMYRDEDMHDKMVAEYRSEIGTDETHTLEKLNELEPEFGLIIIRTNKTDASAKDCYFDYKLRWRVETHYNFVANIVKFCGLQTSDYHSMQGLSFLIVVVGQIRSEFVKAMKASSKYVSQLSVRECLTKASRIKVSQHRDKKWYVSINTQKHGEIIIELGADIEKDLKMLNTTNQLG